MNRLSAPNIVQPNLPLRKPLSDTMAVSASGVRPLPGPEAASLLRFAAGAPRDGPSHPLVVRSDPAVMGIEPPALTVYFCNFCGHQGNFRCKRCKKTPYCSVLCQTEDWRVHRHMCKPADQEPAKAPPKEITASPGAGDRGSQLESKADAASLQRVYLKDLNTLKTVLGAEIQASVVEFYNPGRFYLLGQSPELLDTLQVISMELQKAYSCPPVTTYTPCVGEVCGVQFSSDLSWYRGLVQTLSTDQKTANVLYIDFGNEECVPVTRIRPLSADIQPFCPCAMECCIAGVLPLDNTWSDECCVAVQQLLFGKTVVVKLVKTVENSSILVVDVLFSMGNKLSTFLVEHGYAAEEPTSAPPTQQEIMVMTSASLENFKRQSNGKDDNTWAQPPEPLTQAVGDSFAVVVTHFQSPTDMIVQKVEHAGVIQQLQSHLRKHCSQIPAPQNFRPAPGTVCCAQFSEDKQWYRAKVLAYPSEERVCVGYLDFGNSEEVELGHLRPISASLLALQMQAMPCALAGVQPVGEAWSEDCLLAVQRRVSNRILRVDILTADEGKALVAIIDEASDPQANVAELLISAGYAASAPVAKTGSDQQVDLPPASASAELLGPTPACEPLSWSFSEIPGDGQTVALLPSAVQNPGEFYCRLDDPADHRRLVDLEAELKLHCEADDSTFEPKVGEPCCAMIRGDGAWYRAVVKELSEKRASINIVDNGHSVEIERSRLKSIKQQHLTLPFQAVRCWLSGVEPPGSEWSGEALLCFQTLVAGEKLSARVLSVTEQGYGVELQSRGQNVARALISEQLAKVPGEVPKETHENTASEAKCHESAAQNEPSQILAQASNQAGAASVEMPAQEQTAAASEVPSFPVDWKTAELPLNQTFKPYIAAVTSPSLFYLLGPSLAEQQRLQQLMVEVATYCSNNNHAPLSSAVLSSLAPGAACCVQFSADGQWYRAVVLEVGEEEVGVIYADYGNTEKVALSRILPIPTHLLQLPFQITRCTLAGKEHFPDEWPEEVRQLFQTVLTKGVLATAQAFDGSANVLSLALPTESGGGEVTAMIMDALQVLTLLPTPPPVAPERADEPESELPQPQSAPAPQKELEPITDAGGSSVTPEPTAQTPQQNKVTCVESVSEDPVLKVTDETEPPFKMDAETNAPQKSGCCCASLRAKMDRLEQLMQLQISLLEQIVGQKK